MKENFFSEAKRRLTNYLLKSLYSLLINAHGETTLHLIICGSAVAWWLMPRPPDPEVGGSSPTRVKRVVTANNA